MKLTLKTAAMGGAIMLAGPAMAQDTAEEAPPPAPSEIPPATIDSDGDGTADAWDQRGDGRADTWDTDGDGVPDTYDQDGDGLPDGAEEAPEGPEADTESEAEEEPEGR